LRGRCLEGLVAVGQLTVARPSSRRSADLAYQSRPQAQGPERRALGEVQRTSASGLMSSLSVSKNRVDIVVRPPSGGSIGIEVEWFSRANRKKKRSASVLAQGLVKRPWRSHTAIWPSWSSGVRPSEGEKRKNYIATWSVHAAAPGCGESSSSDLCERPGFRAPGRDLPS